MNRYTFLGLLSWITAGCFLGFQGIKAFMNNNYVWHDITLRDFGNHYIQTLPSYIHFETVHNGLKFFINDLPLYQTLLAAGLIFFIFDGLFRK